MQYIVTFIIIVFTSMSLSAQKVKYSNEFLSIGVGARALAMSNSIVASEGDAYSAYWNPAGLVDIKTNREVALMHSSYFAGIAKYDYGSLAIKFNNNSAAALSMLRFGVDNIPNTSKLIDGQGNVNYANVTSFSSVDYAFIFSYAHRTKIKGLIVGGNAKLIRRKVGDFGSSWGFGLDISAKYTRNSWIMGLMLRDITTTFNAWSYNLDSQMKETFARTGNTIPVSSTEITLPKAIFGIARNFKLSNSFSLLTEINIDITTDGLRNVLIKSNTLSMDPHFGLELDFKKIVFLRAGIGNIQKETGPDNIKRTSFQPNVGLGIRLMKTLSIDYAYTDIGNQSIALYSNVFSLTYSFNAKKSEGK